MDDAFVYSPPRPDIDGAVSPDFDVEGETKRLLAGRTRDIRLTGGLLKLYQARTWAQRSKVVRAWLVWVSVISLAMIVVNAVTAPQSIWLGACIGGLVLPGMNACVYYIWCRRRHPAVEGASLVLLMGVTTVCFGILGAHEGGYAAERYLTLSAFLATVAIMVFGIEGAWTVLLYVVCMAAFLGFQVVNPLLDVWTALSTFALYAMGCFATLVAHRAAIRLSQKTFLLALRHDHHSLALTEANTRLQELATVDPLTGVANRRYASARIAELWRDPGVNKSAIAFLMADIDYFKRLNDTCGHAAGDACIADVVRAISAVIRVESDFVARYGGEEFLIVLTSVSVQEARDMAERIRAVVERLAIASPQAGAAGIVTISLGVAMAREDIGPETVTKWADQALYEAKRRGRNRACEASVDNGRMDRVVPPSLELEQLPLPLGDDFNRIRLDPREPAANRMAICNMAMATTASASARK